MEGVKALSIVFSFIDKQVNSFIEWLKYFFRSKHRKGFGVHSPFAFYLVTKVIEERYPYYKYELIEKVRTAFLRSKKRIQLKNEKGELQTYNISDVVRQCSKLPSYDQVLFRLVNHSKPKFLLELKASLGITSMYLAAPDSQSQLWTIEDGEMARYASLSYEHANFSNIHLRKGEVSSSLTKVLAEMDRVDFLFFNPCKEHEYAELKGMYAQCQQKMHANSVAVIDSIHTSHSVARLWEGIKNDEKVRVTIDMFSYGIIYYKEELQKENYVLRFFLSIKEVVDRII